MIYLFLYKEQINTKVSFSKIKLLRASTLLSFKNCLEKKDVNRAVCAELQRVQLLNLFISKDN